MKLSATRWIVLLAICLLGTGCGGDATTQEQPSAAKPTEQNAKQSLAMVLEVSEPTYWRSGEEVSTVADVRTLVLNSQTKIDEGYIFSIDESHERAGQVRVLFKRISGPKNAVDLSDESDKLFEQTKTFFDERAKQSLTDELAHQQAIAKTAASDIKQLQQTLQVFQEARRGLPATQASRLERRTLDRQIETTLQSQIDANKRIEELQKRIDRQRYVTLIRLR